MHGIIDQTSETQQKDEKEDLLMSQGQQDPLSTALM